MPLSIPKDQSNEILCSQRRLNENKPTNPTQNHNGQLFGTVHCLLAGWLVGFSSLHLRAQAQPMEQGVLRPSGAGAHPSAAVGLLTQSQPRTEVLCWSGASVSQTNKLFFNEFAKSPSQRSKKKPLLFPAELGGPFTTHYIHSLYMYHRYWTLADLSPRRLKKIVLGKYKSWGLIITPYI